MLKTTVGQLLINDALPEDLRDQTRVLDKGAVGKLLKKLYEQHPNQYVHVLNHLMRIGADVAHRSGSSFSLDSLDIPEDLKAEREKVRRRAYDALLAGDVDAATRILGEHSRMITRPLYEALLARDNAYAKQVFSGARGNANQLRSLVYGDVIALDSKDRSLPVPMLRSYAEGLSPVEHFASSYSTRKGYLGTKLATQDAGAWGKEVAAAAHSIVAGDFDPDANTGTPMDTSEPDLSGYVLARDAGTYPAGTVITPKIAADLKSLQPEVYVHSLISAPSQDGLMPRAAFGVRERGDLPRIGEVVGILAAQAVAERLSQSQLGSKHVSPALKGSRLSGFKLVSNLVQVPSGSHFWVPVSEHDGIVDSISDAPQGGSYIEIGGTRHYVAPDVPLRVKLGQTVEAGDILADGFPNPAQLVRLRGIGEGRRQFADLFTQAFRDEGTPIHRRNVDVLARALVNHVRITDPSAGDEYVPGDLVSYDELAERWTPRAGAMERSPESAVGHYLEKPALHYSIGTRITRTAAKRLSDAKIGSVLTHDKPPPFEPEMVRAMETLAYSSDPLARLGGTYLQRGIVRAAARGESSRLKGPSFLPAVAIGDL